MSGKREICRSYSMGHCDNGYDCPYAHDESDSDVSPPSEIDLEEEYYNAGPPSIPPPPQVGSPLIHGKPKGARPVSITIPPATNFLPASGASNSAQPTAVPSATNDKKRGKGPGASSASHRRTRSMSIPPTPGSPLSGTVNLFPAESP